MKNSIRSRKFTLGIILFMVIILLLSVLSCYFVTRLSQKTHAILKENHYSVVYVRDMAEDLTAINKEIVSSYLTNKNPDTIIINKGLKQFAASFYLQQNNITEVGESKLTNKIKVGFNEYRDSTVNVITSPKTTANVLYLQNKFSDLYHQLMILSQINEKAIVEKTNDAKVAARKASIYMSIVGTLCFLIAYGFSFSFSSYFNERFYQLYNGLKEMGPGNYGQRLYFNGKDEIYEISLIFNEMAEKLEDKNQKKSFTLHRDLDDESNIYDIQELKRILISMKNTEEQVSELISKLENKA